MRASNEKVAIITGAPGQDATVLSNIMLDSPGWTKVIVTARYSSSSSEERFKNLALDNPRLELRTLDITDPSGVTTLLRETQPHTIFNLAAASHVGESFKAPHQAFRVNTEGVLNLLEGIRWDSPKTRFVQMSTSEMFGSNYTTAGNRRFQNEETPFAPNSPYAAAKLAAHNLVGIYRRSYGIWAAAAICFNHESRFRGENFVTQKICSWLGEFRRWRATLGDAHLSFEPEFIVGGNRQFPKLRLGNLDARRDWAHAADIMEGILALGELSNPEDVVFCTGSSYSVRDFLEGAFGVAGVPDWEDYVVVDPQFYRPCEVPFLCGDYAKAKTLLGWSPKRSFGDLIYEMVGAGYLEGIEALFSGAPQYANQD